MKDRFTWILGWLFAFFMILMIGVVSNGYSAPTVAGKSPPGPVDTLSSDHMTFIVQSPGLTWQFNLSSLAHFKVLSKTDLTITEVQPQPEASAVRVR
jgi:hypothetical protein